MEKTEVVNQKTDELISSSESRQLSSSGNEILLLAEKDIRIGEFLGSGSFSSVFEATTCKKFPSFKDARSYALKRLKPEDQKNPQEIELAIENFASEAKLLINLRHENIIVLHGISDRFFDEPLNGFLLLEYLQETLDSRMDRWRATLPKSFFGSFRKDAVATDRVKGIGKGIARAMVFLHDNQLLHRDLKPANVGFDTNGCVRLFDFGFCRRYDSQDKYLTRCVGSPRYMAPEVAIGKKYDYSADVYSFGIILWEVFSLKKPFSAVKNLKQMIETITRRRRARPALNNISNSTLKNLLKACWHADPDARPSMALVLHELKDV